MTTTNHHTTDADDQTQPVAANAEFETVQEIDGWIPEDRAPSAAENNFMSFALFGFLILFGIGCFILL